MKKNIMLFTTIIIILLLSFVKIDIYAKEDTITSKLDNINKNENIVFLGDSIFDLFPTDIIFSDLPIVNSGVSGHKTTDVLDDMENRVYKYNPTKVFINIGTNDICGDNDSEELNEEVANRIIEIAKNIKKNRPYCKIYIISIYPINGNLPGVYGRNNDEIRSINSKLKEYCGMTDGVEYLDFYSQLVNGEDQFDASLTNDGLHPNNLGYAKLTEIFMKYIYQ